MDVRQGDCDETRNVGSGEPLRFDIVFGADEQS